MLHCTVLHYVLLYFNIASLPPCAAQVQRLQGRYEQQERQLSALREELKKTTLGLQAFIVTTQHYCLKVCPHPLIAHPHLSHPLIAHPHPLSPSPRSPSHCPPSPSFTLTSLTLNLSQPHVSHPLIAHPHLSHPHISQPQISHPLSPMHHSHFSPSHLTRGSLRSQHRQV